MTQIITNIVPWPTALKRAGGWALLTSIIYNFVPVSFLGVVGAKIGFSFGFVLLIIGLTAYVAGIFWERTQRIIAPIPPLSNIEFWFGRAISDIMLVQFWGVLITIPLIASTFVNILGPIGDMLDQSFLDSIGSITASIPAGLIPISIAAGQVGMLIVLVWRQRTKTIPMDAMLFHLKGWLRDSMSIVSYGILIIGGSALIDYALSRLGVHLPPQFVLSGSNNAIAAGILLFGAIGAPFFEELFFRGYLLSILKGRGELFALIVSSLLFGLIHLQPAYILQLSFVGFILGLSYLRTKNLLVPIIIHSVNNFLAFYFLLKP